MGTGILTIIPGGFRSMSRRSVPKSIYGSSFGCNSNATATIIHNTIQHIDDTNNTDFQTLLQNYVSLITVTSSLIKQFFPGAIVSTSVIADMGVKLNLSPSLFTRLSWATRNKDIKFDSKSMIHLTQLKDIYVEYDMDWTNDPVLKKIAWD